MKIINNLICIIFLVIVSQSNIVAQDNTINNDFRNAANSLFITQVDIDSLCFNFKEGKPHLLKIYFSQEYEKQQYNSVLNTEYGMLNFDADTIFLKKKYPLLFEQIYCKKILSIIQDKNNDLEWFTLSVAKQYINLSPTYRLPGYVYASPRDYKLTHFTNLLNATIPDEVFTRGRDSIIVIQSTINRYGHMDHSELIHGDNLELYTYFMKILNSNPQEFVFKPCLLSSGMAVRSIADIFIRLNSDGTIKLSCRGEYRTLRLRNYKQNADDPIFF